MKLHLIVKTSKEQKKAVESPPLPVKNIQFYFAFGFSQKIKS